LTVDAPAGGFALLGSNPHNGDRADHGFLMGWLPAPVARGGKPIQVGRVGERPLDIVL
jgi:hypothetical protein